MPVNPFAVQGGVRADGSWFIEPFVDNGTTVTHADMVRWLSLALEFYSREPGQRIPTLAEVAAMRAEAAKFAAASALPDGWEATLDGVSIYLIDGKRSWGRTYAYTDADGKGFNVEAPCAEDGSPIPATREKLLASMPPPTPEA